MFGAVAVFAIIFGPAIILGALFMSVANQPRRTIPEICEQALKEHVKARVLQSVREAVRSGALDEPIRKMLWSNPRFRFIKWMQFEMQRVDKSLDNKRAFEIARRVLNENLADEKIAFGDARYAWDKGGAIDLIRAYEIDYWDEAA